LEHFRVPAQVLEFHWPGNERWGKISGACYPLKVRPAQACGAVLADWIRKSDDTVNFVLISHSLGGRLLMEAVQNLYLNGGIFRVQAACLMAPAVPVPYVERGSLGPQSNDGVRWRLLYSKDDSVLKNLFTIGQDAAFDEIHSDAVGFTGEPEIKWPDRWETHQPATRMKRASGYDHGWYWYGGPDSGEPPLTPLDGRPLLETPPQKRNGGESAHIIANLLGASVARRLPDRTLPEMPPLKARVLAFLRP